jgi:radical SAM protein with 4Fe4S-binding SPASM domain
MTQKEYSQVSHSRLELHRAVPLATPLVVYLEPSGFCNLKCGFCPVGIDSGSLKKGLMSRSLFQKLLDDLAAFPDRVKLLRVCGNGEPLINKDLVAMLRMARERKAFERIEMLSNGVLLDDALIRDLPDCLDRLIVSLEGLHAEDYQRVCHTRVDFESFMRRLQAFYDARGRCKLHIKIHHDAVRSAADHQAFLALVSGKCDEYYVEKLVPMWPELDSNLFTHEFRWETAPVKPRTVCAQIFKGLQVQADGEVVPCCVDWKRVNVLGNLNQTSLRDLWEGPALRRLQIRHLSGHKAALQPCQSCTMNDYCEYDDLDDHAQECLERLQAAPPRTGHD